MPGQEDSFDLIRTQDAQANSKSDTFFINPKRVGSTLRPVQRLTTETVTGPVAGGQTITDFAGQNLSVDSSGGLSAVDTNNQVGTVQSNGTTVASGVSTLDFGPNLSTTSPSSGAASVGLQTPYADLSVLHGSPVSVGAADLRLDTGQAIKDGSGQDRIQLGGGFANFLYQDGDVGFVLNENTALELNAFQAEPFRVVDKQGSFTGVQYDTDATAGVLRTPNAGVRVESTASLNSGEGLELGYNPNSGRATMVAFDRDTGTGKRLSVIAGDIQLDSRTGLIDASPSAADLRLATGRNIEDGGGEERLNLSSNGTFVADESGQFRFLARELEGPEIRFYSGETRFLRDVKGGFNAVTYSPSSSAPGQLAMDNSELSMKGRNIFLDNIEKSTVSRGKGTDLSGQADFGSGPDGRDVQIDSNRSIVVKMNAFNSTTDESVIFVDGDNTVVAELDETGDLDIAGSLSQNVTF